LSEEHGQRPPIIYFSNDWNADNRTSSHHIARRLAGRFPLYYIECPGLRAPQRSGRDFRRIWAKLRRFLQGARTVEGGVKVWTLVQVPLHRFALMRLLNRVFLTASLRWLMWREGIRRPITWFIAPHMSNVVGRLGERLSVYYCIDDHSSLPGVNREVVRAMDDELVRKADLVFVSAESLLEGRLPLNGNTHYSPHGVDFDHFARAQDPRTEVPADAAGLTRPVVGFFGLIEKWVDLELIDFLAERRPEWDFLMIGRLAVPEDQLPRRPNIHWLGKRPYDDLPAYGKRFDAAIIPFRLTEVIWHANPIKLREYLAMGKPVVSISTPEIDKYADVVETARTPEEFLERLDAVLARPSTPAEVAGRMGRVAGESWDARVGDVLEVVDRNLGEGTGRVELPVEATYIRALTTSEPTP
jgi:glycosyltransferase involved in cell wall biosynthesis